MDKAGITECVRLESSVVLEHAAQGSFHALRESQPSLIKDLQICQEQHGSRIPSSPSWKGVGIGGRAAGSQEGPCHQQQAGAVLLQLSHHTQREQTNFYHN